MEDTKSCKTLIEQWMDIHGLEFEEEFIIKDRQDNKFFCKIDDSGLRVKYDEEFAKDEIWQTANNFFFNVLNDKCGEYIINKLPYIPADEAFYYIGVDLRPTYCPSMNSLYTIFDRQMRQLLIAIGNCYRTERDARNDKEKWQDRMENLNVMRQKDMKF